MLQRDPNKTATTIFKEQLISMYHMLEDILQNEDFGEDLREELNISFPDYTIFLEKREKDMERGDHGIIIAGMKRL